MKYLLDVNVLIAWRHTHHTHHDKFHAWAVRAGFDNMSTCAHSELGFLRVSMQALGLTRREADEALDDIRKLVGGYVANCPRPKLAKWAVTGAKTTDAYLCQLAAAHKMQLATFDSDIKDAAAFLIP